MDEEEDSDLEIYGTSPGVIAFFMILISLIVPYGILPTNAFVVLSGGWGMSPDLMIYSLIWIYTPGYYVPFTLFPVFLIFNIWFTLPLTIFNIAYIWKIVRYYRGQCTRYSAIWVGILSVTIPTLFGLITTGLFNLIGGLLFIGPIPLQFIAGLIFLYKIPGPEMPSPWRGDLGDHHWWSPKKPDLWYRLFPSSDEDEKKESEPEAKTEWLETE